MDLLNVHLIFAMDSFHRFFDDDDNEKSMQYIVLLIKMEYIYVERTSYLEDIRQKVNAIVIDIEANTDFVEGSEYEQLLNCFNVFKLKKISNMMIWIHYD